jgi:quercetin dioxygenase-like cupin family protein
MSKRRDFLKCTAGGFVAASVLPQFALAQEASQLKPGEPKIVREGEGAQVWAMGVLVTVKVRASDTGGAYSVFEDFIPPGAGPVPHTHTREDETIFVLEGKLRAWLGGKQYDLDVGDFVHMPRGVQHYFKNVADQPTQMLLTYTPGGFEQWFLDIGKAAIPGSKASPKITKDDIDKAVAQAKQYGVQFNKR